MVRTVDGWGSDGIKMEVNMKCTMGIGHGSGG